MQVRMVFIYHKPTWNFWLFIHSPSNEAVLARKNFIWPEWNWKWHIILRRTYAHEFVTRNFKNHSFVRILIAGKHSFQYWLCLKEFHGVAPAAISKVPTRNGCWQKSVKNVPTAHFKMKIRERRRFLPTKFHLLVRFLFAGLLFKYWWEKYFSHSVSFTYLKEKKCFYWLLHRNHKRYSAKCINICSFELFREPSGCGNVDDWLRSDGIECDRINACERLIKVDKQKFRFVVGTTCRNVQQEISNQVQ